MDKVIPWYKMYDFVKSQPQDREIQHHYLIIEYLFFSEGVFSCLLYTSPSPRDRQKSRMPSSA